MRRVFRRHIEAVLLFASLLVAGRIGLAGQDTQYPLVFVPIPWLVWAAFRFGPREAATAAVITAAFAIWHTVHGVGPFVAATGNEIFVLFAGLVSIVDLSIPEIAPLVAQRLDAHTRP